MIVRSAFLCMLVLASASCASEDGEPTAGDTNAGGGSVDASADGTGGRSGGDAQAPGDADDDGSTDALLQTYRNLALYRAAYQSSSANYDNTAHLATDGDRQLASSSWISAAGDTQWIYVDLGAAATIDRVKVYWGTAYATTYKLEVSDDLAAWRTVYSTSSGDGGLDDIGMTSTSARYVRMYATKPGTAGGYSLIELEVYGTGGVVVVPAPLPTQRADGRQYLSGGNWKVQRASRVAESGAQISQPGFDDGSWIIATVPGTVLTSYLDDGAIPDPNFADQQFQVSDAFFTADFWYRDTFTIPASYCDRTIWLNLDGINWKADVYLNGAGIGSIKGAFIRGKFDVTANAECDANNVLAVYVHKNDNPGAVKRKTLASAGGNGGVLGADNPTIHASIGWDWMPTIRGRNTGIQDDVFLSSTGAVSIVDPFVSAVLPLPQTSPADLTVRVDLQNNSKSVATGVLTGTISPGNIQFSQNVSLSASERKTITLDKGVAPQLSVGTPELWWPNGYGEQNMYDLALAFQIGGAASDSTNVPFGIRQITSDTTNNVLTLYVNGKRIFVRGGNWGMSESMLRLDKEGYDVRVRLHREQNFTMIRNWIGMTGSDDFYDACDKYGILVWDDFWLANPYDGPDPADPSMFLNNAADKIRRVRNHPSVALYCGRNEGAPPASLASGLSNAAATLDGTRPYVPNSAAGVVDGGGPYSIRDPKWYFTNAGPRIHSEIGLPNVPPVESMREMLAADELWPINETWGLHDFCDSAQGGSSYTGSINGSYGTATTIEDYTVKAQMVNMESYKAIFEAYAASRSNGALLWMSQSAWPSTVWQTFDYYLEPTAAYFGCKKACEPLHILWDAATDRVKVANNAGQGYVNLSAEAKIYNIDGTLKYTNAVQVSPAADSVTSSFVIAYPAGLSATHFLRLRLTEGSTLLSDNFYWRGTSYGNYTALAGMPKVGVSGTAAESVNGTTNTLAATVNNPGSTIALMIRLKLLKAASNGRVLPTYFSDNYFSLLPGETKQVTLEFDGKYLSGETPKLVAEGWNVTTSEIAVK